MKSKYSHYIGILFATALFTSCEKEITVKVPEYKSSLVLNSSTEVGDTITVSVGKSMSILKYKKGQNLEVTDAKVVLLKDNVTADTLKYNAAYGVYVSNTVADAGSKYTIKVNAPSYTEATATTAVPSFVPIAKIQRIPKTKVDMDGQQQDEIRITFDDPQAMGDYYIISVEWDGNGSSDSSYNETCINTTDASVESIYNENIDKNTCLSSKGIFFRDALFNGSRKEIRLFINSHLLEPYVVGGVNNKVRIVLQHVTEDFFKFRKSYLFASENSDNPFSEPTNVYTNVKNGYGLFSVQSYDVADIN